MTSAGGLVLIIFIFFVMFMVFDFRIGRDNDD